MKIKKILKRNKMVLIVFLVLILINVCVIFSLENAQRKDQKQVQKPKEYVCPIEYSKPNCLNSSYFILFYNPNEFELHKIQIIAKKPDGKDMISVDAPLAQNKTEILVLPECYEIEKVDVKWCCADICYQAPLTAYSEDLLVPS